MLYKLENSVMEYEDEETKKKYLVNPTQGGIFELNNTAEIIIDCVKKDIKSAEITKEIIELFPEVEQQEIESDVQFFLEVLLEKKIISVKC